jgi:hypothetical protein
MKPLPIIGILPTRKITGYDIYEGASTGDYERAGGGAAGLAMFATPFAPKGFRAINAKFARINVEIEPSGNGNFEANVVAKSPILGRRLSSIEGNNFDPTSNQLDIGMMETTKSYRGLGLAQNSFAALIEGVEGKFGAIDNIQSILVATNLKAFRAGGLENTPAVKMRIAAGFTVNVVAEDGGNYILVISRRP